MASHLKGHEIKGIVSLLNGWKNNLSWELLSKACLPVIGTVPARQTLYMCPRSLDAFNATKKRLGPAATGMTGAAWEIYEVPFIAELLDHSNPKTAGIYAEIFQDV